MFKSLAFFSLLSTLVIPVSAANAQSADPQAPVLTQSAPAQSDPSQSAPIVRAYPSNHSAFRQPPPLASPLASQIVESQPVNGVWLRSESTSALTTLSATPQRAEVRLDTGRLNVSVHHPAEHAEILVDLPGGQVSLFKDGFYTFNADTNTVRVLRGEAAAYPGPIPSAPNTKSVKIKEDHQLSLVAATGGGQSGGKSGEIKPVESYPFELTADLLPRSDSGDRAYADYGDGYSPYPYYAGGWGYPYYGYYGYGYPYGYGIGIGYYGGFHGGYGYRGGFRR